MSTFLQWTLPIPVASEPGNTETLSDIFSASFGWPAPWNAFWVTYYPASQLAAWDFSYWNPNAPSVAKWYVNGIDIGGGFQNQTFVSGAAAGNAVLQAGNDIGPLAYITVPSGAPGS